MRSRRNGREIRTVLTRIIALTAILAVMFPVPVIAVDDLAIPVGPVTIINGDEIRTTQHGEVIQCNGGGEVDVFHWYITLSGKCDVVAIKSSGAPVTIEFAGELDVYAQAAVVYVGHATEVDVYGNDNLVLLETAESIEDYGQDNLVETNSFTDAINDFSPDDLLNVWDEEIDTDIPTVTVSRGDEFRTSSDGVFVRCEDGGDVYVYHDKVTITGNCQAIEIKATGVSVSVETSMELDVYGHNSVVTATDVRELDIFGNANTVTIASALEIDIDGDGNSVTIESGAAEIDDEGQNNTVAE